MLRSTALPSGVCGCGFMSLVRPAQVERGISKGSAEALPSPAVTPLGAGSAVRAAIMASEGPPGAGVDGGPDGWAPESPLPGEEADTPRLPQAPVISRFETDVAGRPSPHGERHP